MEETEAEMRAVDEITVSSPPPTRPEVRERIYPKPLLHRTLGLWLRLLRIEAMANLSNKPLYCVQQVSGPVAYPS